MSNDAQQQMIREAMKAIAERRPGRTKLVYDKTKRTIVAVAEGSQPPRALNISADDADMFGPITLSAQWIRAHWSRLQSGEHLAVSFTSWDSGDALTQRELGAQPGPVLETCSVALNDSSGSNQTPIRILIKAAKDGPRREPSTFEAADGSLYRVHGHRRVEDRDEPLDVVVVEVQPALAERRTGLFETTLLHDQSVVCFGLGTGGAHAAIELAKCGVGRFTLIDPDRLTVGNVVRHPGGLSQVGRLKVNVVRDLILEKNPEAQVDVHAMAVDDASFGHMRTLVGAAKVVIAGTDNRPSKLLINQLCLDANVPALYGGAFRRAYGGQVLRVRPGKSPCQQCFISTMPSEAADTEIASASDAEAIAYSDRPVAIEPGLSLDVLPIATFLTKLALLELLIGKASSLSMLHRDFEAPWYLWLNRPEPGTQYATLPPLSDSIDEMTIQRWYGVEFDRDKDCPACGDFLSATAGEYGIDLASLTLPSKG
jgi:molybdopterin/thiamine biosynthesis adenylyltransferase